MHVLLAGPIDTQALARSAGLDLSACPPGIAQTPLAPLAAGLLQAGHRVHIVTLDPSIQETRDFDMGGLRLTFCPLRGAPVHRARERSRDFFASEIAHLRRAMERSEAEIVHAHWTYEYAEAALQSRRPTLITLHDLGWSVLLTYRNAYRALRLAMKLRVMMRAPRVSAVSPQVGRRAWHYGHFKKVEVVPNPIEFAPVAPKDLGRPILVTVGDISRLKNVRASLAAFEEIRAVLPAAELHLFGPGLDREGRPSPAETGVSWHGKVPHDELMQFLRDEARLLIHPSLSESFGVVLGEAKMRGVPVIAGRSSGGAAFVAGEAGGILVDVRRPDEIARAALSLLLDDAAYRSAQLAAHADIVERFSVDRVVNAYLALYRGILR